jgi:hypothetical protein
LPRSATRSAAAPTSGHARRRGIEAHEPVPPLAYLSVHRRRPTDCSWVGTPSDAELHGQAAGRPARLPIHPLTFGDVAVALVPGAGAPLKQTLLALRGGRHLAAHDAPGAATLQVLRGRVRSSKEALGARSKSWRASGPPRRWTHSTYPGRSRFVPAIRRASWNRLLASSGPTSSSWAAKDIPLCTACCWDRCRPD